jgi:hypothetical protein
MIPALCPHFHIKKMRGGQGKKVQSLVKLRKTGKQSGLREQTGMRHARKLVMPL